MREKFSLSDAGLRPYTTGAPLPGQSAEEAELYNGLRVAHTATQPDQSCVIKGYTPVYTNPTKPRRPGRRHQQAHESPGGCKRSEGEGACSHAGWAEAQE